MVNLHGNETDEVILERMKSRISNDIDRREGSVVHDLLTPAAYELAQMYMALDSALSYGLDVTADSPDEFVEMKVKWAGIERKPGVQATGTLVFIGPNGMEIPQGTQARTTDGVYFETTQSGTIVGGTASVPARAIVGGISGNVFADEIIIPLGEIAGYISVTNPNAFEGGLEPENNESLLARYFEKIQRPATSGNAYHYEQWAKEVPGVADAKVIPVWDGPGTVKVVLIDDEKQSPAQSVIDNAIVHIEANRPIGAQVTVAGAARLEIHVTADVYLVPGTLKEEVEQEFVQRLETYLASIAFVDNALTNTPEPIRYTRVANLLLDTTNVNDFENLLINGVASNIEPTFEQVAVVGEVTFT